MSSISDIELFFKQLFDTSDEVKQHNNPLYTYYYCLGYCMALLRENRDKFTLSEIEHLRDYVLRLKTEKSIKK